MGSDKRKMIARVRHKQRKQQAAKCTSKRAYLFTEAQLYAKKWNQAPYKCPICKKWHLTSEGK